MKKYLIPALAILFFASSVMGATVFNIQQGGTNNGSAPATNSLIYFDGTQYTATSTQPLYIGSFVATTTATSTAVNGIDISGGCFAVNGTCVTGGGGGGYTNLTQFVDQTAWRIFYSNTDGDVTELALGASGTYLQSNGASSAPTWVTPSGSSPWTDAGSYLYPTNSEFLDVSYYVATSSNATSTFAGSVSFGEFDTFYSTSTNGFYVDNLYTGPQLFETDAGIVSWIDMPVSSSASDGTVESYIASLDGNPMFTIYGQANGSGGVDTLRFGFGTTTPPSFVSIIDDVNATTTVDFGEYGNSSSKACFNTKNTAGSDISFYFVGTTMQVESNRCN